MFQTLKSVVFIGIILSFSACSSNHDIDCHTYYSKKAATQNAHTNRYTKLSIDTLAIHRDIESSFIGFWVTHNKQLVFVDYLYGYLFTFDAKGNLQGRHVGRGSGPDEMQRADYAIPFNKGYYLMNAGNSTLAFFNKNWQKEHHFHIDWDIRQSVQEVLRKPDPQKTSPYEFDYGIPEIVQQWDKNHVAIAITASHPKFNGYFNSELYYKHSRILALVDVSTHKITSLIGRRPPFYLKNQNIPNFDHFNYKVEKNEFFVDFWADSLIYRIDKNNGQLLKAFGKAGKNMRTDYRKTYSYEEAEDNRQADQATYDYYHYLTSIPEEQMIFRGYTLNQKDFEGLQVYEDDTLAGEFQVPKGFKLLGKIANNLIAINEYDEDALILYKVTIQ